MVTLTHTLIIAPLASFWFSTRLPYVSITLGIVALVQWLSILEGPIEGLPIALAGLALLYGSIGYGLNWIRQNLPKDRTLRSWLVIWKLPLQQSILKSG